MPQIHLPQCGGFGPFVTCWDKVGSGAKEAGEGT